MPSSKKNKSASRRWRATVVIGNEKRTIRTHEEWMQMREESEARRKELERELLERKTEPRPVNVYARKREEDNWKREHERVHRAYQVWKANPPVSVPATEPKSAPNDTTTRAADASEPSSADANRNQIENEEDNVPETGEHYNFTIDVLDMHTLQQTANIRRKAGTPSTGYALMLHRYLGNTPVLPSLGISVRTVEYFRAKRDAMEQPRRFDLSKAAKELCDVCRVPYKQRYRTALKNALNSCTVILENEVAAAASQMVDSQAVSTGPDS